MRIVGHNQTILFWYNLLLLFLIVLCGLMIVRLVDQKRLLLIASEKLIVERDRLTHEWMHLQYEQSVLSKVERIEHLAFKNLKMCPTTPERMIYIDKKTLENIDHFSLP